MRSFDSLSEREILALAITSEEEDSRIYGDFAEGLRATYPATAKEFDEMRLEEAGHRDRLFELYKQKFGEHIPMIRREDIKGFARRRPRWLARSLGPDAVRKYAIGMEAQTRQFYDKAAQRATDASVRELLNKLSDEERKHSQLAAQIEKEQVNSGARSEEEESRRRLFLLQIVQPGLVGLMDGSVSTLAPVFAAALANRSSTIFAFKVGLAASVGAGISMGFAEALSDDGALTGRGHPWARGIICGLMTTLGGIGHTLPFLIPTYWHAIWIASIVVVIELAVISWIRHRYMDTPWVSATVQVAFGGALVFAAGVLIGGSS